MKSSSKFSSIFFAILLAIPVLRAQEPPAIGGLYEICIGVEDPLPEIQYWTAFGYRIGETGSLTAKQAKALYGVNSVLTSVRLLHQDADHGLVRLMAWEKPTGDGLGLVPMLTPGSRWASALTEDVMRIYNHAELARAKDMEISIVPPQWAQIFDAAEARPFVDDLAGVRELIVLMPLKRRMFYQRFGYVVPNYGKVHPHSKFRTSQITHVGLVFQSDDPGVVDFYKDVLGLQERSKERRRTYDDLSQSSRNIYAMRPGEEYYGSAFEDPRSPAGKLMESRSGVLMLRRIPGHIEVENCQDRSRPGSLGMSLYTYRVASIEEMHAGVMSSAATRLTPITENEFGEPSFSFIAPDGSTWTLVGSKPEK